MLKINKKENLKTCWSVGGAADFFCKPSSKEELKEALLWAGEKNLPAAALGAGANVLVSDQGVEGLVISTARLSKLDFQISGGAVQIHALSGVFNIRLMKLFQRLRLAPAFFLSGLPGTVGGGVVMNAGAGEEEKPSEFSHIVRSIEVVTKEKSVSYHSKDIAWSYRQGFQGEGIVYSARMEWPLQHVENFKEKLQLRMQKRRGSQPLDFKSAGSVFKNPKGFKAGRLIEGAGLKGLCKGKAFISPKHSNFIVHKGGAAAKDIRFLIETAKKKVREKYGVSLEEEVRFLGRWPGGEKPS